MNTANNHIETFDISETTVIAGKYTVQYGLGTQKFLDEHDILDGRKHLVAKYMSEISSFLITVVENELPNCLKENDDDLASGIWTVLTYVGAFETDEDAATMITEFLKDYEQVYHSDSLLPMEALTCGYQDVSRSISENVNTKLDFRDGSETVDYLVGVIGAAHEEMRDRGCKLFDMTKIEAVNEAHTPADMYVLYDFYHIESDTYKSAIRSVEDDVRVALSIDSDVCDISAVTMSNDVQDLVIKHFNSAFAEFELSLPS